MSIDLQSEQFKDEIVQPEYSTFLKWLFVSILTLKILNETHNAGTFSMLSRG